MAKGLPGIIYNLPKEGLPESSINLIQNYTRDRFYHLIDSLPEHQRNEAYKIVLDDIKHNNGKEFGKYITL